MKRRAVCLFVLVLWLLGACTVLSLRIEEWMCLRVTVTSAEGGGLPLDCLYRDEEGDHLYRLNEGVGWEKGMTIQEEYRGGYFVAPDLIRRVMSMEKYVRYASRQPVPGEKALLVGKGETGDDVWLAVFPDALPEELPEGVTLLAKNGSAALYGVANAAQPFIETRARSMLGAWGEDVPVFSLGDVDTMLESLPALAAVAALILAAVALWGWSCFLSREAGRSRALLGFNALLGVCALGAIFLLLRGIELPTSLLPSKNIFDLGHYRRELDILLPALRAAGAARAENTLALAAWARNTALGVFGGAGLGTVMVLLVERFLTRRGMALK